MSLFRSLKRRWRLAVVGAAATAVYRLLKNLHVRFPFLVPLASMP